MISIKSNGLSIRFFTSNGFLVFQISFSYCKIHIKTAKNKFSAAAKNFLETSRH
jgi:hypothetical protein